MDDDRAGAAGGASRAARPQDLRSRNLASLLSLIYGSDEPLSRAGLAHQTGLNRSTVSRLIDELVDHGFVAESAPVPGQRGRPGVPLMPTGERWLALGLELNVQHLAARLITLDGRVVFDHTQEGDHASLEPDEALRSLTRLARRAARVLPAGAILVGARLAVPGLVDTHRNLLLRAPNLGWRDVAPVPSLAAALRLPEPAVTIGNEADCAALSVARQRPGLPSGFEDFLYVSGEVGIGPALVRQGRVTPGRHGWAGEIGHLCIDPSGPRCACGATGCLETFAGQSALHAAAGVDDRTSLRRALAAREPRALQALREAARAVGIALSSALNLLDVTTIVLGGHLGELADELQPGISRELSLRVLSAPLQPPQLIGEPVTHTAAATGAAWAILETVLAHPVGHFPPAGDRDDTAVPHG